MNFISFSILIKSRNLFKGKNTHAYKFCKYLKQETLKDLQEKKYS